MERGSERVLDEQLLAERPSALPWKAGLVAAVAIIVLGGGGYLYHVRSQSPSGVVYTAIPAVRGSLSATVSATGPVSTAASIPLTFKNSGQLTAVLVKAGDNVTAGQVLARESTSDLKHAVDAAQATVDQQTAILQQAQAGPTAGAIAVARAAVDTATAARVDAEHTVAEVQHTSAATLATAQHSVANASLAVTAAQQALHTNQAQQAASARADATNVANAQAAVTAAQAAIAALQQQVAADTASDQVAVTNASTALDDARANQVLAEQAATQALTHAQQAAPVSAAMQAQQLAAARNALLTAQVTRDGACGQSATSTACKAGDAAVNTAQTGVDQAAVAAQQAEQQAQQAITAAQQQIASASASATVDAAAAALATAKAALKANQAKYQGSMSAAQAQLGQAQGALRAAQDAQTTNAAKAQQSLAASQQQIEQATAALTAAHDAFSSAQAQGSAAIQQAQQQLDQAQAQQHAAEASLEQASAPPTPAAIAAAQAQLNGAKAALATAQGNLADATLESPIDATVAQVNDIAGQYVSGGADGTSSSTNSNASTTAFIVLTDLHALQVVAQVNEADMAQVVPGLPVRYTLNAFPDQQFTGRVAAVQPLGSTSNNVVSYDVTCTIDTTTARLLPGMTAVVSIITASRNDVIVIPSVALTFAQASPSNVPEVTVTPASGSSTSVLVLRNGTPVRVNVQTGLSDGTRTEIVSGLQSGDRVITGVTGP